MTGADAPRKLGTHNERSPGKCGEDGRLKEAKPSPKVNHLPLVLRPGRARKLFECSFGRKSKKEASGKCSMKQPPNKCPQSSAEEPNSGERRVDFTFAFIGNSLPSSWASCPLTAAMFGLPKTSQSPS